MVNIKLPEHGKESRLKDAAVVDSATLEFRSKGLYSGILASLCYIVRRKRFIATLAFVLMAAGGFLIIEGGYLEPQTLFDFLNAHPKLAPAAFVALYVMMTLLLLPTLPLNLGAGFLWGPYWGGLYTVIGASLGAALAFLVSRYLAAEWMNRHFTHRTWVWLLEQVSQQDWKVVAFTRINPIFPTAALNYFFGLTTIKFWSYLLVTVVFIAPMVLFFAYLGDSVGGYVLTGSSHQFAQNIFGASSVITILVLSRFALKKLTKISQGKD